MLYSVVSFINCEALCFAPLSPALIVSSCVLLRYLSLIVRPCVLLRCLIHLLSGLVFYSVASFINCEVLCFTPLSYSLIVRPFVYSDVSFINCDALCFTPMSHLLIGRHCVLLRCLIH